MGCWSLLVICVLNFLYAGVGHLQELRVCREKPRPAQLAAIRPIVRDARWLVGRAREDGAAQTTAQNFTQVLKHMRVGYTGEEVSRPEPLTLLEIIPGLPPAGAAGVVDPLTLATGEVQEALFDPSLVLLPEAERVGVRPARVHATDEEWNKIGAVLLQRGAAVEMAREDAPIVDGQPVLVGAFGVQKRGTPLPPATRVLRLIVNANKHHIEQMPVEGEWLHNALETDEIVLWSSDDIQGCFHVFSLPLAWRRWMILSKPIRVAMPAGGAGVLTSNDQLSRGGNAPRRHSNGLVVCSGCNSTSSSQHHLQRSTSRGWARSRRRARPRQALSCHIRLFHALVVESPRRQFRHWRNFRPGRDCGSYSH